MNPGGNYRCGDFFGFSSLDWFLDILTKNKTMRTTSKIFYAVTFFALSSCSTNYYIPNSQNVPMLKEKGEADINVVTDLSQLDFQAAYAVGDAVAVQANGMVVFPQDEDNSGNGGKGQYFEAGVGFFKKLSDNVLFDTYLLGGIGSMENHFPGSINDNPNTTGKISANLYRFGLQPSISYYSEYFSVSGSARFVNLTYSNIDGSLHFNNLDQSVYLNDNRSNFLIEPAITVRGGLEKIKLQVQYLHSFNVSNSDFPQSKDLISFGLNFHF